MENVEQQEGESHRGGAAYNGHHTAGQHPVYILGSSHCHHHRNVHFLPEIHALNEVGLFGKGKFGAVAYKQQDP